MTTGATRAVVGSVMACHFIAAFAALGMPPFFATIVERSLNSDATYLVGWLYVVPTFFTALSSPWWGRLADRYGKKRLLVRAQIGLAASFLLAGFAESVWAFSIALCLQGLLGGTFGASNAYLATVASGAALTRSLTLMQWSARAALVIAPIALGLFIAGAESPVTLYRYLALLPLLAAFRIWRLPAPIPIPIPTPAPAPPLSACTPISIPVRKAGATPAQIYGLQFVFVCATVMTFPYFVPLIEMEPFNASPVLAGLLFGLPHLAYLAGALPLDRCLARQSPVATLAASHLLFAASLFAQSEATSVLGLAVWRIVMGAAMTAGYIGLHALMAAVVHSGSAGVAFGRFESSAKWGAVAAGIATGVMVQFIDLRAPFYASALLLCASGCYAATIALAQLQTCKN